MVLSGLFLMVPLFVWVAGPFIALVNLYRLRKGRILLGREESLSLSSYRKTLFSLVLKRTGRRTDLRFPLFDISYHVELAWFHREGKHIWRRWEKTIPLNGEALKFLDVDCIGLARGDYRGRDGFLIADWFGFFRYSLVSSRPLHVKVMAHREKHTPPFTPSPQAEGVSSFVSLPSEEELVENRPYFPGDDPRKINWKQYARFSDLFIRTAHDPLPNNKWVLCLLSGEDFDLEETDRAAGIFLGFCRYLEECGCEVYTLVAGQDEIGLSDYSGIPPYAPGDRLLSPVHSPGHVVLFGREGSGDTVLWRNQAREQRVPFTLFDYTELIGGGGEL